MQFQVRDDDDLNKNGGIGDGVICYILQVESTGRTL